MEDISNLLRPDMDTSNLLSLTVTNRCVRTFSSPKMSRLTDFISHHRSSTGVTILRRRPSMVAGRDCRL
jgi:hypothetical protein